MNKAERELLKRLRLAPDVLDAVREQLDQAVLLPANAGPFATTICVRTSRETHRPKTIPTPCTPLFIPVSLYGKSRRPPSQRYAKAV